MHARAAAALAQLRSHLSGLRDDGSSGRTGDVGSRAGSFASPPPAPSGPSTVMSTSFVPQVVFIASTAAESASGGAADSSGTTAFTFAVFQGVWAPLVTSHLAASRDPVVGSNPDIIAPADLGVPQRRVGVYRPVRPRWNLFAPLTVLPAVEVLLAWCDVAQSLGGLHEAGVECRNVQWPAVYLNVDAPGARLPCAVGIDAQQALTRAALAQADAKLQAAIVDAVGLRSAAELPSVAPEDRNPSFTPEERSRVPLGACDAFALGRLLDEDGIAYELLNAKPENVEREAEIVAQSGRRGGGLCTS